MKSRVHTRALAFSFASAVASFALPLGSDTLPTGDFEDVDGPGGYLVISPADNKQLAFQLVAYGANRHTCGLSGIIVGSPRADVRRRPQWALKRPIVCEPAKT